MNKIYSRWETHGTPKHHRNNVTSELTVERVILPQVHTGTHLQRTYAEGAVSPDRRATSNINYKVVQYCVWCCFSINKCSLIHTNISLTLRYAIKCCYDKAKPVTWYLYICHILFYTDIEEYFPPFGYNFAP